MAQKLIPQPNTIMGAFNETWNISHDKITIIDKDNPKIRLKGGKWVVGNLRFGGCYGSQQRTFARIGYANNTNIGNEL